MSNNQEYAIVKICHDFSAQETPASTVPAWLSTVGVPIETALLGLIIAWIVVSFERKKTFNQELVKKRLDVYEKMSPNLNRIYCFFIAVGDWKKFTPIKVIEYKRELDQSFYIYKTIFSPKFALSYHSFIDRCFKTYTGNGKPAQLRINGDEVHRKWGDDWLDDWDNRIFSDTPLTNREEIINSYNELMRQFSIEVGVR